MSTTARFMWGSLFLFTLSLCGASWSDSSGGEANVEPQQAVSGEYGTWVVTYTVGDNGIVEGGVLRVQMLDEMHSGVRNSANRLQTSDPKAPNYVTAKSSREDVRLRVLVEDEKEGTLVKHPKQSLDGRYERYVMVVRVEVVAGALKAGDSLAVTYGDTSQGSPGCLAGDLLCKPQPVLMAMDADGRGRFVAIAHPPAMEIVAGDAAELLVHGPSRASVGRRMTVTVVAVDKAANPAPAEQPIRLTVTSGEATYPQSVTLPEGQAFAQFEVMPRAEGVLRITAALEGTGITGVSNPCEVFLSPEETQLLWGDLHSHTRYSWDGVGFDEFGYAQYVSGLDFYARTDHAMDPEPEGSRGLRAETWESYCAEAEAANHPPDFVTLHAYECSFGTPYGHHNVYFRGLPGPLIRPQSSTLPALWDALVRGEALTIPHHTGKFPAGLDFTIHDPELRRNFEIYSGHGLSETYDPTHPLAFEQSDFTSPSKSLDQPSHAQDVWRMGLQLSTVAASDDHRSKPGQPHFGLTAIYAPENSREGVFDALYNRRTYGTTGAKIILDFVLDDVPMGAKGSVSDHPVAAIHVIGTDTLRSVELLAWRPGDPAFSVAQQWEPAGLSFDVSQAIDTQVPGTIYYVRVLQSNTLRGRTVMAWSSPVWTDK